MPSTRVVDVFGFIQPTAKLDFVDIWGSSSKGELWLAANGIGGKAEGGVLRCKLP